MEPRRVNGKNHWYHETQSTICPVDVLPLVPEAAHVEDRFFAGPGAAGSLATHPTQAGCTPLASWQSGCFPTRWR